jgi:cytochrome c-type biogenesis protein CcmH
MDKLGDAICGLISRRMAGVSVMTFSANKPAMQARPLTKALVAIMFAALILQLGAAATGADSIEEQTSTIAKQLKCPVCQNIPVAYSQSQLAGEMRAVIREKVAQGESEETIIQYFVDRYGEDVLLEPRREGFGLLLWVSSVGVIFFGAAIVAIVLWNWSQSRSIAAAETTAPADPTTQTSGKLDALFEEEYARYKQGKRP